MTTAARATFSRMSEATAEDYKIIGRHQAAFLAGHVERILAALRLMGDDYGGFAVTRLDHCLQSATRAVRDGRTTEYVVACLLHDIGDHLAPMNHGDLAAAIVRPYVSERMWWIVGHHGIFQFKYYGHHVGFDPDMRDRYRDHPWFDDTVEFCERYDENCFDPSYDALPLEAFETPLREVFGVRPFSPRTTNRGSAVEATTGAGRTP